MKITLHNMCAVYGGGGGRGGAVHLGVSSILYISVLGYTMSTFVGGVKCILGIFECIGGYHQCIREFQNNSDIPPCTAHMLLRVKIVTQFKNNLFVII